MRSSAAATLTLVALGVGVLPGRALAQAWVPPRGDGVVTITYQDTLARGHLFDDGRLVPGEQDLVHAHAFTSEIEWGLTDKIALNVALPFVAAKYRGNDPHPVNSRGEPKPIDDGLYHGGAQDFRFGLRYGLKAGALAVAPFAEGIIPSHHYEGLGHAAIGKDLRAFLMGVSVGGFLDSVAPGLYFQTRLSYGVAQEVAGIRPNRSSLDSEVGYFVTPRLAVRFLESLQITHDGLRILREAPPPDFADPQVVILVLNHDRLLQNTFLNLGGGVGFALTDSLDMFAAVVGTVWGRNVHPHRGVTVGLNRHFRAGGGAVAPNRNSGRSAGPIRPGPHVRAR